jgi:hypothetical protein
VQRDHIRIRYSLLNYLYTEYAYATIHDATFYRPLFFVKEVPAINIFDAPEKDILIGRALKHSPIYTDETHSFFFP